MYININNNMAKKVFKKVLKQVAETLPLDTETFKAKCYYNTRVVLVKAITGMNLGKSRA